MPSFVTLLVVLTQMLSIGDADTPAILRETLKIGDSAPDFDLPGIDGGRYRLSDFVESRLLLVVFTCNHCPTAQAYEQRLVELSVEYSKRDVAMVAVTPNDPQSVRLDELGYTDLSDSFEETKLRAEAVGFDFPYLYDGDTQAMARAYGPVATPHVFIFDENRTLRFVGRIDDDENPGKASTHDTRNALDALLTGVTVPVERTRVFGCTIKWSDKRASAREAIQRWNSEPVDLRMIDLDSVSDLVGNDSDKLLLINVWATWCGPCITEFPDLVEINRMYRGRPFELVTISADEPEFMDEALETLKKHHVSTRNYLLDSGDQYALMAALDDESPGPLPYSILVEPEGKIIYRHLGDVDPLELKRMIVDALVRTYFARPSWERG
jgi:peroxiredoxin